MPKTTTTTAKPVRLTWALLYKFPSSFTSYNSMSQICYTQRTYDVCLKIKWNPNSCHNYIQCFKTSEHLYKLSIGWFINTIDVNLQRIISHVMKSFLHHTYSTCSGNSFLFCLKKRIDGLIMKNESFS